MDFLIALFGLSFIGYWIFRYFWKRRQVRASKKWVSADATIQSADMEIVHHSKYGSTTLPCFTFSYVVNDEYYSGEFSLDIREANAADTALQKFVNHKIKILFDPQRPDRWYIPEPQIEGYEVHQKLEPTLIEMYPRD